MLSDVKTIEHLLREWGRWAYASRGVKTEFPAVSPMFASIAKAPPTPSITDEEAETVDRVVSRLKIKRPDQWEALALYYIAGKSYRNIAKDLHTHHRVASDLVNGGKMWVEGAIFGYPLE